MQVWEGDSRRVEDNLTDSRASQTPVKRTDPLFNTLAQYLETKSEPEDYIWTQAVVKVYWDAMERRSPTSNLWPKAFPTSDCYDDRKRHTTIVRGPNLNVAFPHL